MSDPAGPYLNGREAEPNENNVEKIRDILFGQQMRDYDRRFASTEERLVREAAGLRDDLGRRLLATEQYLRAELETLSGALRDEERDRLQGIRDVMDAMASANREMSDRLTALADQTAQQQRELRALLQDAQRVLGEESTRRAEEAADALRREAGDLRSTKADRATIAAMFAEFAHRLAGDDRR